MGNEQEEMDRPSFSRGAEPTTELRGECPRSIVNVLDAISMARGFPTRNALVNQILTEWVDKVLHEHSVLQRVVGINPAGSEAAGRRSA